MQMWKKLSLQSGAVEASGLSESGERAPIEQQHWEQECDSSLRQDTEPTATEGNQGLNEQPRGRWSQEELRGQESGHMAEPHTEGLTQGLGTLGSETAGSKVIKSDPELDCTHNVDLCRTQYLGSECGPSAAGAELGSTRTLCGPSLLCDHIKTEDDTLESVYTVEQKPQTPFRETFSHLKTENIADNACDLGPELPVAGQCDAVSATLRTGLSRGSDNAVSGESPSSQRRQQCPRPSRQPPSSSSPSSPLPLRRGKQLPQPQGRRSYTHIGVLSRHSRSRTEERLYSCAQCGKVFRVESVLKIHQRTHTGERPYSCAQCGKGFSQSGDLKLHQRIHTGERLYCCTECGKSFTRVSHLYTHRRTHTGERPYRCSECGKSFTTVSNLHTHRRIHTGEKPYYCSQCGKSFSQAAHLNTHQRTHS
ncbi:zinc finger protein 397 isoform X2 [Amia ocellicauda]|uniref:zinc finger protein 397 isoform X2 n=1 Tax=Amia ocellicauda TaxID=2972642 RepID=UPI003464581F